MNHDARQAKMVLLPDLATPEMTGASKMRGVE